MADYFVKKTGNDSNNGTTWALAKLTIQAALNLANAAGDRVIVAPGVYNEVLSDPAADGTSGSRSFFIADTASTIQDGGSNTSGVTAGPVRVCATPSTGTAVIEWDGTDYWTVRGFWFETTTHDNNDYRAGNFGLYSSPTHGKGIIVEDCVFIGNVYGCIVNAPPYSSADADMEFRRCYFSARNPLFINCNKGAAFSASPDVRFISCIAINRGGTAAAYSGFGLYGDGSNYVYAEAQNCTVVSNGMDTSAANTKGFTQNNTSYCKWNIVRCVTLGRECLHGSTNATATNCYSYTEDTPESGETKIDPTTKHAPMILMPMWYRGAVTDSYANPLSYTPTGDEVYDFIGGSLSTSPGAIEYVSGQLVDSATTHSSGKGAVKLWSSDYPDVGNVTEDDTVQGVTGTYHEPTTAEVQNGVAFGAGSALTGTYTGGGSGGYVHRHITIGSGVR